MGKFGENKMATNELLTEIRDMRREHSTRLTAIESQLSNMAGESKGHVETLMSLKGSIWGNGKPGLTTKVDRLEGLAERTTFWIRSLIGTVVTLFIGFIFREVTK